MNKIKKQLIELGFNINEIDVYLSILKLKNPTITEISKNTDIKRTSIYYCLENLMKKGLISRLVKDNQKRYYPESPTESLENLVSAKALAVKTVLPELQSIYGIGLAQPEIKIYREINGLRQMFLEPLKSKEKVIRYYLANYNMEKMLGQKFVDDFVEKRIAKKIRSLSLRSPEHKPKREIGKEQFEQLRQVKYLPKSLEINPYMIIYDNKVAVVSTPDEKLGFIVESKEFADAQKAIFDYMWKIV